MTNLAAQKNNELLDTILALKDRDEARNFFRDLLTEKEIIELANRWKAARMLDQRIPYTKIQEETGLSSTTIARIAKWLTQGMGGYKLAIDRLGHHHDSHSLDSP